MADAGVVLVVNEGARGAGIRAVAQEQLAALGLTPDRVEVISAGEDVVGHLRAVVRAGCRLLVVAGGDGTLSAAANALADTDVVLGVLPAGTANDFARTLQIPADVAAACQVLREGRVQAVDVGLIGSRRYLNLASVGLATLVTQHVSSRLKKVLGPLAYPIAAARAYLSLTPFAARLEFPGGDHPDVELAEVLQIGVANGRYYGGGAVAAPDAGITEGTLDVYAIPQGSPTQRLQVVRHFSDGSFTTLPHVFHVATRAVRVVTAEPMEITVDGELGPQALRTPQTFQVLPAALPVLSAGRIS